MKTVTKIEPLPAAADLVWTNLRRALGGAIEIEGSPAVLVFGNAVDPDEDWAEHFIPRSRSDLRRDGFAVSSVVTRRIDLDRKTTWVYTATPPDWMDEYDAVLRCDLAVWAAAYVLAGTDPDRIAFLNEERKHAQDRVCDLSVSEPESFTWPAPTEGGAPTPPGR